MTGFVWLCAGVLLGTAYAAVLWRTVLSWSSDNRARLLRAGIVSLARVLAVAAVLALAVSRAPTWGLFALAGFLF